VNVLAIDQGTSATKALVVGTDGTVLSAAETSVRPRAVGDRGIEQDPEELWTSVVTAGRAALASAAAPVGAVGLANQGETVLAWDRADGRAQTAPITWGSYI
jgi:glycerol kinase